MNDAVSQRFERVEAHVAHLERQVEQLNEVLIDQGRQIEQLKKLVQRQATTLEAIELERIKASNPRPPHH
jgi:uncharacterized coiled-coil protein SlyX